MASRNVPVRYVSPGNRELRKLDTRVDFPAAHGPTTPIRTCSFMVLAKKLEELEPLDHK